MTSRVRSAVPPDLDDARLLVASLQAEPLTIQAVEPSPCSQACPAGINVKSYVSLIAEERFVEALEVVRERCPLPGICGRICHHPCEGACKRSEIDEPIAIRSLKRFVSDLVLELPPPEPPPAADKGERVAVIGSGPAGLTAAYDLRRAGYPVTVFETDPQPGGMLRYGIADYRLPSEILDAEIALLVASGVEIETGCRIGKDRSLEDLLGNGFAAVLFAVGAQKGRQLRIEGEDDCLEVEDALSFLRRVNTGHRTRIAGTVLVVGGGSTAIEAARAALRLGARQVEIVYRRQRTEMPADQDEIEIAAEEGIAFRFLTAPSRVVIHDGSVSGLECLQVALGAPDASGRRRPLPIAGSEFLVQGDRILTAVGQQAALDFLPDRIADRMTKRGFLAVDSQTSMTAMQGVFAAGDVVSGPSTVIDAIAAGHDAATAISSFLTRGHPSTQGPTAAEPPVEYEIPTPPPEPAARRRPAHVAITPGREFAEVEGAFSAADAVAEARRCMRCGPCSECLVCARSCDRRHVTIRSAAARPDDPAVLLRAPLRVARELLEIVPETAAGAVPGHLEHAAHPLTGRALEIIPTRITIDTHRCRGCARCIDVCSFGAISLLDANAPETTVQVSAVLCRGCNLCTAACPTDAAAAATMAPGWWGTKIEDLYPSLLATATSPGPLVALACQRRVGAVEAALSQSDLSNLPAQVVPIRCAGQIAAGTLLELYRHGAGRILVAGCLTGSCRYDCGPQLAAQQVLQAQAVLDQLGAAASTVITDWGADTDELMIDTQLPIAESPRSEPLTADRGQGVT